MKKFIILYYRYTSFTSDRKINASGGVIRSLTFEGEMLLSNFATDPSLSLARRGFSPGTPVFPYAQKPSFANSDSTRNQVDEANHNHYLFYFYIYWRPNYGLAQTATFAMMKQAWNQANLAFYNKLTTAKMRISCHFLPIESGRYKKTPRAEKLCHLCNRSEIGDESTICWKILTRHFLI